MSFLRLASLSPASRIALGLVSLMLSLVMVVDLFVGFLPDRSAQARRQHAGSASLLAAQLTQVLRSGAPEDLQAPLAAAARFDPLLRSAAVRLADGELIASVGEHARLWSPERSAEQLRAPIVTGNRPWGELQLVFASPLPTSLAGWLLDPLVLGLALSCVLGFVGFQLYLRRVLRYLDPDSAVPERVRTAFDTLTEGVLVLDPAGHILLANKAFRCLHPEAADRLTGRSAESLAWLVAGTAQITAQQGMPPWRRAAVSGLPLLGQHLSVDTPAGRRELVMNCAPITDGSQRVRGSLATFADVTVLEERTQRLRVALDELQASQAEIERQNEELTRLATRDPLTGCLNRRSFMAEAEQRFAQARQAGTPLACIMCDIDHFKSVNDRYGHAAGDQVIQAAAKALARGLRVGDFLGRYGGEEFCIMLPGATSAQAGEIAERLRADVQASVGSAMRDHTGIVVTMSFGAAPLADDTADPATIIDRADQALYYSKKNGRNRVTSWLQLQAATPPVQAQAAEA